MNDLAPGVGINARDSCQRDSWTADSNSPSAPRDSRFHLFKSDSESFLLLAEGSRVFRIDSDLHDRLRTGSAGSGDSIEGIFQESGIQADFPMVRKNQAAPRLHALSLAVAQKCNLGCTYCYAQGGAFGAPAQNMPLKTALEAVELLFREASPGDKVSLSFLGGEPLMNRSVIRAATVHAAALAVVSKSKLTLSITSNGTLVRPDDFEFFENHGFAVTISLDGIGDVHDRQRPLKNGAGSYEKVVERIRSALNRQRLMQISARVTVTPVNLDLVPTLEAFMGMGFHSVGFSPLLNAPAGGELGREHLAIMLEQMISCGRRFESSVVAGRRYPFSNMVTALKELHWGNHNPYPCGAGIGYFGVDADGVLYACHRFVNDDLHRFGSVTAGVDRMRQEAWMEQRHVNHQEPCRGCWARYLCGGGCHHEVIKRGRHACDYIRGWLHYCLGAYTRLLKARPDYFAKAE
jgi:uncharacterized protein